MIEGAEYPPSAVHRQVAGCPDRRSAHIAGKNSVLRSELVEHSRKILRMDGFTALAVCCQFIEALACLSIMFKRGLQMRLRLVLVQFWQKRANGCLRISNKAVVDFCAPAQLFSTDINLNNGRVLGIELLVRKIGSDHQQHLTVHHGVIARGKAEQAGHTHIERVVILDELFATHRMHNRGVQFARERDQLLMSSRTARSAKNRCFCRVVQHLCQRG